MAATENNVNNKDNPSVILTEEDIPGAKLPRESVEKCSVVQLKRWLLCRGAKTTGVKKALVARVYDYKKHGLDAKYLRDPDGGVNLLRKKAELGVLNNEEPEITESFPKGGFSSDLSRIPKISFGTVWRFMIENVECKKQLSTAKPLVKGFNFFKSGHVLYIGHLQENGKHFIKSQVLPSMKKDKVYTCFLVLTSIGKMLRAHCKCPAGIDGRCNHVASTLFALEHHCKEKEKQTVAYTGESCTSQPCKWNVPRKRKGPVQPITQMTFVKHDYAKEKKIPKLSSTHNASPRCWDKENITKTLEMMKKYQEESGNIVSWTHILPQDVSPVKHQHDLLSPIKSHPVSAGELKERFQKVKRNLMASENEIKTIEENTRGQSKKELWHHYREPRITATKCYRIAVQKETTSPTKIIKDVLGYNKAFQSKSMEEGLKMEDQIISKYKLHKQKQGVDGIRISKSGFFVSKDHGFLGASHDGLVHDPSTCETEGLIEVKYVQTSKDETLEEALVRKGICKQSIDNVKLNETHKYFYQVQQQMFVTERKWTDFVVMGSGCSSLFCDRVYFSEDQWKSILTKLESPSLITGLYQNLHTPELNMEWQN